MYFQTAPRLLATENTFFDAVKKTNICILAIAVEKFKI